MSAQSSHDPVSQAESSFCQAIFFFHACGCRTPEPFFVCQPPSHSQMDTVSLCRHEEPALVVAKLPHACEQCIGNGKVCDAKDLSATTEFVREVDTAEQLELVVSKRFNQVNIHDCLPKKVEGTFTVDKIVSKLCRDGKCRSTLSATAAPFVPRLEAYSTVMANTAASTDGAETPYENHVQPPGDMLVGDAKMSIDEEFSNVDLNDPSPEDMVPKDEPDSNVSSSEQATENEESEYDVEHADPYDNMVAFQALKDNRKAELKRDLKPTRSCFGITFATLFGRQVPR
ncbi:hypothetical protein F5Y09DRAFT_356940 [Xylaria sp. FL1042]|nr:hypothetical protein F5Y09DRAFT_356940 [Xylaria sp. FL1042]